MDKPRGRCQKLYEKIKNVPGSRQVILRSPFRSTNKSDQHIPSNIHHYSFKSSLNSKMKKIPLVARALFPSLQGLKLGNSMHQDTTDINEYDVGDERDKIHTKPNRTCIQMRTPFAN